MAKVTKGCDRVSQHHESFESSLTANQIVLGSIGRHLAFRYRDRVLEADCRNARDNLIEGDFAAPPRIRDVDLDNGNGLDSSIVHADAASCCLRPKLIKNSRLSKRYTSRERIVVCQGELLRQTIQAGEKVEIEDVYVARLQPNRNGDVGK